MRNLLTLLTCLFILSPNVVLSETVKSETVKFWDLVERKGLYYQKSSDVPFSGTVTGQSKGKIKKGKLDGPWVGYYDNGNLSNKGTFKYGKEEGLWVSYYDNGQLEYKGTYKDGKPEGPWVNFKSDGTVNKKLTGTYKNGKKISD